MILPTLANPADKAIEAGTVEAAISRQAKVATYHRQSEASPEQIALGRRLFFDPRRVRECAPLCR